MMAKTIALMLATMAAMTAAVPAYAQDEAAPNAQQQGAVQQGKAAAQQQEASATGVVEDLGPASEGGASIYGIFGGEEIQGYYYLRGDADFASLVGQEVTAYGTLGVGEQGQTVLNVSRIEPTDGGAGVAAPGDTFTVSFELFVEGEVPEGTQFFAGASQQTVGLEDPDGDGAYTGALELPSDFGAFPIDVNILAGTPEDPEQEIKNFDEVVLEDGDVFSASYSFEGGEGTTPNEGTSIGGGTTIVDEGTTTGMGEIIGETTGPAEAQYEDGGGTAQAAGIDLDEDGVVSESDGEFATQTSDEGVAATPEEGALPGTGAGVLPSTGGLVLPVVGLAGVLLLGGGLLLRKK